MNAATVEQSMDAGPNQSKAAYPVEEYSSSMPSSKELAVRVFRNTSNTPSSSSQSNGQSPIATDYSQEGSDTLLYLMDWERHIPASRHIYYAPNLLAALTQTFFNFGRMFTDPGTSETVSPVAWDMPWLHSDALDLDPLNITHQLEEMKALEDGWAEGVQLAINWGEGYGKAPKPKGLDWLAGQFNTHYAHDLPRPYLYPTPEGGVQAEWSLGPNDISLEIDLTLHSAEWLCFNLRTDRSSERILKLDDEAAWRWIDRRLRQLGATVE